MIHPITTLPLSSRHRVSQITFHPTQSYLAVQSHDRSVEIFRIRTEEEVRKKQARRKKRSKEKKKDKDDDAEVNRLDNDAEIKLADLFTPYLIVRASGKIRSFEFGADDVGHKGGTQVSGLALFSSPISMSYDSSSPLWRRTPSRSITYPNPPNQKTAHPKRLASLLSICPDTEQMYGH
jgi:hypothetical protein